mmetsp:Transcript_22603/g.27658  ORF Transcript_22603/g.27658 Transcript_22603/m.27658 type:complete len:511 (+) Transcript_22603:23-1555(+)
MLRAREEIYDEVWKKYLARNDAGTFAYSPRSWQALRRHYKLMKTIYSRENNGENFVKLYEQWKNVYNRDYVLLHPSYFKDSGADHKKLKADIPENVANDPSEPKQSYGDRANSWDRIEEILLVGAIMNRFLTHGSLTSPRKPSNKAVDQSEDCWQQVKVQYELAWQNYTAFAKKEMKPRTVNALSRHYKVMKVRMAAEGGKETLNDFYDQWSTLNADNRLVRKKVEKENFLQRETRLRVHSWTEKEEIFLWGVMVMKFLNQCTLFYPLIKMPKGSSAFDECFKSVKIAYDLVWNRYLQKNPDISPNRERTWNALSRHYKGIKTAFLKSNNGGRFYELYEIWRNSYNKDHELLDELHFSNENLVPEVQKEYDEQKERKMNTTRCNSWSETEEVLLVGAVMDRFLNNGSLTIARKRATDAKDNDSDPCWSSIKLGYETAWANYTRYESMLAPNPPTGAKPVMTPRTVNALSRHFKIMRTRIAGSRGKERLNYFYEKWRVLNGRGILLNMPLS